MSYDVYLRSGPCAHCGCKGLEPDSLNPTYNLTPIFDLALTGEPMPNEDVGEVGVVLFGAKTDRPRGLRVLNGKGATETVPTIESALRRLRDPGLRETFIALEPDNKWGTLKDAVWVLENMRNSANDYPDNKWEIR